MDASMNDYDIRLSDKVACAGLMKEHIRFVLDENENHLCELDAVRGEKSEGLRMNDRYAWLIFDCMRNKGAIVAPAASQVEPEDIRDPMARRLWEAMKFISSMGEHPGIARIRNTDRVAWLIAERWGCMGRWSNDPAEAHAMAILADATE